MLRLVGSRIGGSCSPEDADESAWISSAQFVSNAIEPIESAVSFGSGARGFVASRSTVMATRSVSPPTWPYMSSMRVGDAGLGWRQMKHLLAGTSFRLLQPSHSHHLAFPMARRISTPVRTGTGPMGPVRLRYCPPVTSAAARAKPLEAHVVRGREA
jgi:hypothetical protein